MKTKERLISFLKHVNMSQGKFEKHVGLSNGFVNNVGDTIRTENLQKISAKFPELNTAWLLTGEGNMLNHPGKPAPGDRANPMRAYMLAVAHNYATWRVDQEMPDAPLEKKKEAVKKIKQEIDVTANLILGGLDQWPFDDLKG